MGIGGEGRPGGGASGEGGSPDWNAVNNAISKTEDMISAYKQELADRQNLIDAGASASDLRTLNDAISSTESLIKSMRDNLSKQGSDLLPRDASTAEMYQKAADMARNRVEQGRKDIGYSMDN